MDKPKRGLTPEQWIEVRKAYEFGFEHQGKKFGPGKIAPLARKYGTSRNAIKRHVEAETWVVDADQAADHVMRDGPADRQALGQATKAKVISILTGRALDQIDPENLVGALAEELVISQRLKLKMAQVMETLADGIISGAMKPSDIPATRDWSQFIKDSVGAYKIYQSTLREDIGRKAGEPTVPSEVDDGKPGTIELEIIDSAMEAS